MNKKAIRMLSALLAISLMLPFSACNKDNDTDSIYDTPVEPKTTAPAPQPEGINPVHVICFAVMALALAAVAVAIIINKKKK